MTKEELLKIIARHKSWINGSDGGCRADLSGANLSDANLSRASLIGADLTGANLSGANLIGANLSRASLIGADLIGANLSGANLSDANLSRASLIGADLIGANLSGANLSRASLRGAVGGNSRIQSLQISPYKIIILDNHIVWGGCTKKTAGEWLEYDGEELSPTDKIYLETVTKQFIRMVCR